MTALNGNEKSEMVFIENLTFLGWMFSVWPYLVCQRRKNVDVEKKIYYFDATFLGLRAAGFCGRIMNLAVEQLKFRLTDIRDEEGNLQRLKIAYFDLADVQRDIVARPIFERVMQTEEVRSSRLKTYLEKQTMIVFDFDASTVWRMLLMVHAISWQAKKERKTEA